MRERITRERHYVLRRFQLDPHGDWKSQVGRLPATVRGRVQWSLFQISDEKLDAGYGACILRRPELSKIVEDSLLYGDGDRYVLTDAVVMPNHVHLLAAFRDEEALVAQCTSWKRFTATRINAALSQRGPFWQVEQFDHLVRSEEQFA